MVDQKKAKRNKDTICATVSPYVKKRVLEYVEEEEFSSMSDLVSVAVTEFIARRDADKQRTPLKKEPKQIETNDNVIFQDDINSNSKIVHLR